MSSTDPHKPPHWLDRYATGYHQWHRIVTPSGEYFARHLGVVEQAFDHDGTAFEGRADINTLLACEVQSRLSSEERRAHVLRAWATLRAEHALLRARAVDAEREGVLAGAGLEGRCFVVGVPGSVGELLAEAEESVVFLEDYGYGPVDERLFYRHCMNTGRCFDAAHALSRLFVLPLGDLANGNSSLHVVGVFAHQILDGLTMMTWNSAFVDLLNLREDELDVRLARSCNSERIRSLLPQAQEDLYPPVRGTKALVHWKWAISRILRHTRRPPLDSFANPVNREKPLVEARRMPPAFDKVLNYDVLPPLNSFVEHGRLGQETFQNFRHLCREAKASVGAGCFALVGLTLAELEERRNPSIPLDKRAAFVAGFPLNPRPFIKKGSFDSVMLAFSDGISLPFLPSYLAAEGRFKLLARLAHRQLGIYQKRPHSAELEAQLGSRSPSQFIPSTYLGSLERLNNNLLPHWVRDFKVQGGYPASFAKTGATCGVSSIGNQSAVISADRYALDGSKAFTARFQGLTAAVRARGGEFLVGAQGDANFLGFNVAYDANAVDEGQVQEWKRLMETLLAPGLEAKL